jgi:hypothetical protein
MVGFMSDATHLNVSDPNSMMSQGGTRNCVYQFGVKNVPDVNTPSFAKSYGQHERGLLN